MRKTAYIFLLLFLGLPALSSGEQPLETLRNGIDKGIRVLEDPELKHASQKNERQQRLWEIMLELFDFKEFSRRVLSSHWKEFTPQQREEFVIVFGKFLGTFYLGKLQEKYRDETVIYLGQSMIGKSKALVEIKVFWKNLEIPVTIRMTNRGGTWKAYDLSALGVSAVMNYRAQFQWILRKESPAQVIEKLKERLRNIEKET